MPSIIENNVHFEQQDWLICLFVCVPKMFKKMFWPIILIGGKSKLVGYYNNKKNNNKKKIITKSLKFM